MRVYRCTAGVDLAPDAAVYDNALEVDELECPWCDDENCTCVRVERAT